MLELASVGAKVLQTRSVGLAMRYNMALQVLSSFEDRPGTLIVSDDKIEELNMEQQLITGIAHDKNEARVTLTGLPDKAGHGGRDLRAARQGQHQRRHDRPERGRRPARPATLPSPFRPPHSPMRSPSWKRRRAKLASSEIITDTDVVKVSAVGIGMRSNAGIAAKMFETLAERGINILAISTSEIKVSVLLPEEYTELAVRVLHTAFGLDRGAGGMSGEGLIAEPRAVHASRRGTHA